MDNRLATLPEYEAYKDSGVEWIGEIPAHWNVKRESAMQESFAKDDSLSVLITSSKLF